MFIVYIKVLLYGKEPGKALKIFCLFGVIFGCVPPRFLTFFSVSPAKICKNACKKTVVLFADFY